MRDRLLEAQERLLGPEHPSTLTTVGNLGLLYDYKGDYEQAEAYYTRCLEARERLLGPEHPDTLATVGNLGLLYSNKGDYEQAEGIHTYCLEARERLLVSHRHIENTRAAGPSGCCSTECTSITLITTGSRLGRCARTTPSRSPGAISRTRF